MKKHFSLICLFSCLLLSSEAAPLLVKGSGGDIVVCQNILGIKSYETFDIYEATTLNKKKYLDKFSKRRFRYHLGFSDLPYLKKIEIALKRFSKRYPLKGKSYFQKFEDFKERHFIGETNFLSDEESGRADFHKKLPRNCQKKLAIVQASEENGYVDFKYLIDASAWSVLSQNSKAALVLHEIIYSDLLDYGARDSREARILTAIIVDGRKHVIRWEEVKKYFSYRMTLE